MASQLPIRRTLPLALALLAVAAVVSRSPAPASAHADKKAEGAELFGDRGCTHCHGPQGEGTDRGPALRDLRKHLATTRIQDQIVHGGQGMPAFGDILSPAEVDSLVAFLHAKKWTPVPAPHDKPAEPAKKPDTPDPSPQ